MIEVLLDMTCNNALYFYEIRNADTGQNQKARKSQYIYGGVFMAALLVGCIYHS